MESKSRYAVWKLNCHTWLHRIKISPKDTENWNDTLMLAPCDVIRLSISYSEWRSITRPWNSTYLVAILNFAWIRCDLISLCLALLPLNVLLVVVESIVEIIIPIAISTLVLLSIFKLLERLLSCIICLQKVKVSFQFVPDFSLILGTIFPDDIIVIEYVTCWITI